MAEDKLSFHEIKYQREELTPYWISLFLEIEFNLIDGFELVKTPQENDLVARYKKWGIKKNDYRSDMILIRFFENDSEFKVNNIYFYCYNGTTGKNDIIEYELQLTFDKQADIENIISLMRDAIKHFKEKLKLEAAELTPSQYKEQHDEYEMIITPYVNNELVEYMPKSIEGFGELKEHPNSTTGYIFYCEESMSPYLEIYPWKDNGTERDKIQIRKSKDGKYKSERFDYHLTMNPEIDAEEIMDIVYKYLASDKIESAEALSVSQVEELKFKRDEVYNYFNKMMIPLTKIDGYKQIWSNPNFKQLNYQKYYNDSQFYSHLSVNFWVKNDKTVEPGDGVNYTYWKEVVAEGKVNVMLKDGFSGKSLEKSYDLPLVYDEDADRETMMNIMRDAIAKFETMKNHEHKIESADELGELEDTVQQLNKEKEALTHQRYTLFPYFEKVLNAINIDGWWKDPDLTKFINTDNNYMTLNVMFWTTPNTFITKNKIECYIKNNYNYEKTKILDKSYDYIMTYNEDEDKEELKKIILEAIAEFNALKSKKNVTASNFIKGQKGLLTQIANEQQKIESREVHEAINLNFKDKEENEWNLQMYITKDSYIPEDFSYVSEDEVWMPFFEVSKYVDGWEREHHYLQQVKDLDIVPTDLIDKMIMWEKEKINPSLYEDFCDSLLKLNVTSEGNIRITPQEFAQMYYEEEKPFISSSILDEKPLEQIKEEIKKVLAPMNINGWKFKTHPETGEWYWAEDKEESYGIWMDVFHKDKNQMLLTTTDPHDNETDRKIYLISILDLNNIDDLIDGIIQSFKDYINFHLEENNSEFYNTVLQGYEKQIWESMPKSIGDYNLVDDREKQKSHDILYSKNIDTPKDRLDIFVTIWGTIFKQHRDTIKIHFNTRYNNLVDKLIDYKLTLTPEIDADAITDMIHDVIKEGEASITNKNPKASIVKADEIDDTRETFNICFRDYVRQLEQYMPYKIDEYTRINNNYKHDIYYYKTTEKRTLYIAVDFFGLGRSETDKIEFNFYTGETALNFSYVLDYKIKFVNEIDKDEIIDMLHKFIKEVDEEMEKVDRERYSLEAKEQSPIFKNKRGVYLDDLLSSLKEQVGSRLPSEINGWFFEEDHIGYWSWSKDDVMVYATLFNEGQKQLPIAVNFDGGNEYLSDIHLNVPIEVDTVEKLTEWYIEQVANVLNKYSTEEYKETPVLYENVIIPYIQNQLYSKLPEVFDGLLLNPIEDDNIMWGDGNGYYKIFFWGGYTGRDRDKINISRGGNESQHKYVNKTFDYKLTLTPEIDAEEITRMMKEVKKIRKSIYSSIEASKLPTRKKLMDKIKEYGFDEYINEVEIYNMLHNMTRFNNISQALCNFSAKANNTDELFRITSYVIWDNDDLIFVIAFNGQTVDAGFNDEHPFYQHLTPSQKELVDFTNKWNGVPLNQAIVDTEIELINKILKEDGKEGRI